MSKLLCCQGGYPDYRCGEQDNCTGPVDPDDPCRDLLQRDGINEICKAGKFLNGGTDMHKEELWD